MTGCMITYCTRTGIPPYCDCVTPSLVYQHVKDTVQELVGPNALRWSFHLHIRGQFYLKEADPRLRGLEAACRREHGG